MPQGHSAWHWPDFAALRRGHHAAAAESAPTQAAEPDEAPKQDAPAPPAPRKPKADAADSAAAPQE
jgi:hypothetical protein